MTAVLVQKLQTEYDALRSEFQVCRRKLDSKCEALSILSQELDQCRSERDQFKLMAEQLRERYQGLKRQLAGLSPRTSLSSQRESHDLHGQSLAVLLCDMREANKSLQFEVDDLKQKLVDSRGDIKLLREQIARQRVGTTDEGLTTRHFPAHEREDLVRQLEAAQEQYVQIQRDLQQVLDEKEELVTERDVYKNKYERLNTELNYILKGDEKRIIDIDALAMENKYLQERLKQMEEEKSMAMATVSKYKNLLERKKSKGIIKLGQSRTGGMVITQKQVKDLLERGSGMSASPQTLDDLQSVARALLDTVNDKNLALSHQRKTNKILGSRVAELEKKLKTLEVSGLWNIPGRSPSESLEKLKMEFEDMKMLIPQEKPSRNNSSSSQKDLLDDLDSPTELSPDSTPVRLLAGFRSTHGKLEQDLDLLPTKEEVTAQPNTAYHAHSQNQRSTDRQNPDTQTSCERHNGADWLHDSLSQTQSDLYSPTEPPGGLSHTYDDLCSPTEGLSNVNSDLISSTEVLETRNEPSIDEEEDSVNEETTLLQSRPDDDTDSCCAHPRAEDGLQDVAYSSDSDLPPGGRSRTDYSDSVFDEEKTSLLLQNDDKDNLVAGDDIHNELNVFDHESKTEMDIQQHRVCSSDQSVEHEETIPSECIDDNVESTNIGQDEESNVFGEVADGCLHEPSQPAGDELADEEQLNLLITEAVSKCTAPHKTTCDSPCLGDNTSHNASDVSCHGDGHQKEDRTCGEDNSFYPIESECV